MSVTKDRQTRVETMGQDRQENSRQTAQAGKGDAASVLARKTHVGRASHQARSMSLPKALRLSVARVAENVLGMAIVVIGVRMEKCDCDGLDAVFQPPALLMLLDGPSRRRAAVAIDPVLVGGLIQQQTMGTVLPDAGDNPRPLTDTDAAICAPFLDALLERAAALPETEAERQLLQGFRFGARADDRRLLLMALEDPQYQVVHLTVDIAEGKRQGHITLCMPLPVSAATPERTQDSHSGRAGDGPGRAARSLNETVLGLHIDLNIALARVSMPLSAVGALKVGDTVDLGVTPFDQSHVLTMAGRAVGRGSLGQLNGLRAVQMHHQNVMAAGPRRRADDRDELDLPEVTGDGTGTRGNAGKDGAQDRANAADGTDGTDGADRSRPPAAASGPAADTVPGSAKRPDASKMPDMSDLPGLSGEDDFPELRQLEAG